MNEPQQTFTWAEILATGDVKTWVLDCLFENARWEAELHKELILELIEARVPDLLNRNVRDIWTDRQVRKDYHKVQDAMADENGEFDALGPFAYPGLLEIVYQRARDERGRVAAVEESEVFMAVDPAGGEDSTVAALVEDGEVKEVIEVKRGSAPFKVELKGPLTRINTPVVLDSTKEKP